MNQKSPKLRKWTILLALAALIAALGFCVMFLFIFPKTFRADFDRFSSEAFDSAFLSMYPIDNYEEEEFAVRWGGHTIKTTHEIPNDFILECYLWKIERTKQNVYQIFLGIQPEKSDPEKLSELLALYPQYHFQVTLPYPSLEYWTGLSDQKCALKLQDYRECIAGLSELTNVSLYFFGSSQWLVGNTANYEDDLLVNTGISNALVHLANEALPYYVPVTQGTACIDELEALIQKEKETPARYIDLTGEQIVFFGDSVIGNFTNTSSIPNVTGALTGADAYNLGYGGTPAAPPEANEMGLVNIVNAFLQKNPAALPAGSQSQIGLTDYLEHSEDTDAPYCFVINYGLNDYYIGAPIATNDPYNPCSFTGAFRTAVTALHSQYPDARILVITPNFTSYYNNGTDANSEHGHVLTDYVDALIALSEELPIELLDNYHELPINPDNHWNLLSDGCHPNETGRFLMGQRISEKLSN